MTSKKKDPALQSDKEVVILPAETKLKDKIGDVSIAELLSPSRVARVQQLVNDRQKDFLGWVEDDLKVLETCYKSVSKNINKSIPHFTKIKSASFTIKSQAGTFGFDLASEVARSLHNFCEQKFR